jgi:hypothetical protein
MTDGGSPKGHLQGAILEPDGQVGG